MLLFLFPPPLKLRPYSSIEMCVLVLLLQRLLLTFPSLLHFKPIQSPPAHVSGVSPTAKYISILIGVDCYTHTHFMPSFIIPSSFNAPLCFQVHTGPDIPRPRPYALCRVCKRC